ncbi:hypothetical protein JW911_03430 [Candidatus Peregrinibacteria bacterium]|nr:hypothetical protein [Candidatus Peregrinibacteria bacterium]
MADVEFFGGLDANADKVDPAAFEKFKERVKAAAAQIKALQAGEQKQRKKEEKLIRILLKFVKTGTKRDIMLLIARLLEQNVPPLFILSIVTLGNEDVKKDISDEKLLSEGKKGDTDNKESTEKIQNQSLSVLDRDKSLPLKLKIEIDEWMKYIYNQAFEDPHRLIRTSLDSDNNIILPLVQLPAFILRDYLDKNSHPADYEKLKEFSKFFIIGIIEKAVQKSSLN